MRIYLSMWLAGQFHLGLLFSLSKPAVKLTQQGCRKSALHPWVVVTLPYAYVSAPR